MFLKKDSKGTLGDLSGIALIPLLDKDKNDIIGTQLLINRDNKNETKTEKKNVTLVQNSTNATNSTLVEKKSNITKVEAKNASNNITMTSKKNTTENVTKVENITTTVVQ